MKQLLLFLSTLLLCGETNVINSVSLTTRYIDDNTYELRTHFDSNPQHFIYADYFDFYITDPQAHITDWKPSVEPVPYYSPTFKATKKIFNQPFDIIITATSPIEPRGAHLLITYYPHNKKNTVQEKLLIMHEPIAQPYEHQPHTQHNQASAPQTTKKTAEPWYAQLGSTLKTSDSFLIQILLAFLLGLLLSLTPCIYPMIPITIGILQAQGSKNIARNFLLSLSYTIGIATTFAILGLVAASTGHLFGNLMNNPWFIIAIVCMLAYFSGAMIGFYNLYIPGWFQPKHSPLHNGSFISAFIFGAISGTVASPCLSPGLILLLTMVSALSNLFLGFALLFCFGIGLSVPLLLIGTFSSSLSVLPRAGSWMVEIKQLLGFMMLGVSFYFMRTILPWHSILWMFSAFLLGTGLWYAHYAYKTHAKTMSFKNMVAVIMIATSVFVAYNAAQETWGIPTVVGSYWHTDYEHACAFAKKEKIPILLEISMPSCSICNAIDKKIFCSKTVTERIKQFCVPVKIGHFDTSNPLHAKIKEQFSIMGVPACCIINPEGEELCKFWGSELYDLSPAEFMQQLTEFSCKIKQGNAR